MVNDKQKYLTNFPAKSNSLKLLLNNIAVKYYLKQIRCFITLKLIIFFSLLDVVGQANSN